MGRVTAGIDWASEEHAVAIVSGPGRPVDRFCIAHTGPDLRRLIARLRRWGVTEVSIERPDGPVVDALLEAELTVFVHAVVQIGRFADARPVEEFVDGAAASRPTPAPVAMAQSASLARALAL